MNGENNPLSATTKRLKRLPKSVGRLTLGMVLLALAGGCNDGDLPVRLDASRADQTEIQQLDLIAVPSSEIAACRIEKLDQYFRNSTEAPALGRSGSPWLRFKVSENKIHFVQGSLPETTVAALLQGDGTAELSLGRALLAQLKPQGKNQDMAALVVIAKYPTNVDPKAFPNPGKLILPLKRSCWAGDEAALRIRIDREALACISNKGKKWDRFVKDYELGN